MPPKQRLTKNKLLTATRTQLKVTICLYLSPSNRARSLSTPMSVDTTIDTPQKTKPAAIFMFLR